MFVIVATMEVSHPRSVHLLYDYGNISFYSYISSVNIKPYYYDTSLIIVEVP